jgi:hypothetical protein
LRFIDGRGVGTSGRFREADVYVQSAIPFGLDVEGRVVRGRDRGDDREAEAMTGALGGPVGLQAAEGLQ